MMEKNYQKPEIELNAYSYTGMLMTSEEGESKRNEASFENLSDEDSNSSWSDAE